MNGVRVGIVGRFLKGAATADVVISLVSVRCILLSIVREWECHSLKNLFSILPINLFQLFLI